MSRLQRQMIEIEIENLETILAGGSVRGVVLNQNGMTAEAILDEISERMTLIEGCTR